MTNNLTADKRAAREAYLAMKWKFRPDWKAWLDVWPAVDELLAAKRDELERRDVVDTAEHVTSSGRISNDRKG